MSREHDPLTGDPGRKPDPLVAALTKLEPAPVALNRDRIQFAAGAASRTSVVRLWQLTAGFLAAAGFAAGVYVRGPSVVYVDRPTPAEPVPAVSALPPAAPKVELPSEIPPNPVVEPPSPIPASPFFFNTSPPSSGDPVAWLQMRNDVLTGGLGLLPDPNRPRQREPK